MNAVLEKRKNLIGVAYRRGGAPGVGMFSCVVTT